MIPSGNITAPLTIDFRLFKESDLAKSGMTTNFDQGRIGTVDKRAENDFPLLEFAFELIFAHRSRVGGGIVSILTEGGCRDLGGRYRMKSRGKETGFLAQIDCAYAEIW